MDKKLSVRDLINIGLFTAIYFIVFFAVGMIGVVPILFVFVPVIAPIILGVPFLLFLTRVNKFGMITIKGLLLGSFMFMTGHTWIPLATGIIFAFLADIVLKRGQYRKVKYIKLGYSIFSMWYIGALLPIYIMRDSFFKYLEKGMGIEYVNEVSKLFPMWTMYLYIVVIFISGYIGSILGKKMLKKHFKKAGIA